MGKDAWEHFKRTGAKTGPAFAIGTCYLYYNDIKGESWDTPKLIDIKYGTE